MIRYPMKFAAIAAGIVLLVVSVQIGLAQTKAEKIDTLMKKYQEYGQFNGSVLVAERGKVIFKKGTGLRIWNGGYRTSPIRNSGSVLLPNNSPRCSSFSSFSREN